MNLNMINSFKKSALILFLFTILFNSCTRDEIINVPPPTVTSTTGAYVLSEGGFSQNTSKLSLYSIIQDTFYTSIFYPGNLGLFASGMLLYNNYLFVLEQGSFGAPGKIYQLDTTGNVLNSKIIGINPYSLTVANNKIYYTNGPAGNVGVLNVNDLSFIKNITVGAYPQEITSFGGKVFVCNTSIYGGAQDSTVSFIDSQNDLEIFKITVKKEPTSVCISRNNTLIIGCNGINGLIYIVDPNTYNKIDSLNTPEGFGKDLNIDSQTNNIYFISYSGNIVKLDLDSRSSTTVIQNQNPAVSFFYGYSFDSKNRKHYLCDARNFTSNGYYLILNMNNIIEKSFSAGIAPRRIVLKSN
jgi:YVTN family beta-propeller protein